MTPRKPSTTDATTDNVVAGETSKKQSPAPKGRAATKTANPAKAEAGQNKTEPSAAAKDKTPRPRRSVAKDAASVATGSAKRAVAGKKTSKIPKPEEAVKAEKAEKAETTAKVAESAPVATGKGTRAKSKAAGSATRASTRARKAAPDVEADHVTAKTGTPEAGVEKAEAAAVSEKPKAARPKGGRSVRSHSARGADLNNERVASPKTDTGNAAPDGRIAGPEGLETPDNVADSTALSASGADEGPEKNTVARGRRGVARSRKKSAPAKVDEGAAKAPISPVIEIAPAIEIASPPPAVPATTATERLPAVPVVPAIEIPPTPQASISLPEPASLPSLPEPAPASVAAPADFSVEFDDFGSETSFTTQESEVAETESDVEQGSESGAKKRRGRSRRGGRGRKKAQTALETTVVEDAKSAETAESVESSEPLEIAGSVESGVASVDKDEDHDLTPSAQSKDAKSQGGGKRKMFVCVLPAEQIEVVVTEEGQVQEYYVEMLHQAKIKGNIYKATVHNVDPNLQAAFVNYGAVKNGFLQIDEVHPEYYVAPHDATKGRKYPLIQKVLKPGQELLVQVVKEPAGSKGAFLTTYLSMPGRFLVLTPGREQIGVSRKVEDETERARLRELLEGLSPGPGLGVIVRTVSMGASKTSLQRDLQFLKRTWKEVRARGTTEKTPSLVYQEMDLTSRAVRDYLTDAIGEVWIDDQETAQTVTEIAEALFPRKQNLVRFHKDHTISLFERFNLQRQLDQIHSREVSLPSGGRLVIDPTEALTAIDINSGRSSGKNNFEDMAYRTNMEAAKMIPLQLRLRDIGGQVVADFIEMRDKSHWREVEKTLRNAMKIDRARYDIGKISSFGLLEIVRQRLGSSAISISTEPCPCCNGTGVRRNMEWQSQIALREILRLLRNAQAQNQPSVTFEAVHGVAMHLLNHKRQRLLDMEERYGVRLDINISLVTQD